MPEAEVDPVLVQVVRGALASVAEEIGISVVRSAYSTVIKEGGDVSGAIFDATGRLVAQSETTLVAHMSSLRASLQSLLGEFPVEEMAEGDILLMNDPYRGGVHANDLEIFRPVVLDGRVAFFTGTLVHVADLGGISPGGLSGTATDLFQEGLVLPPVFLGRGGQLDEGLLRVIGANSRSPEKALGDLRALVAGANVGARRLQEVAARPGLGPELLAAAADALIAYTERRTRAAIGRLPPGRFTGESVIDDDGLHLGQPLFVRAALGVEGGDLVLDFTGTDRQAGGAINASRSQATSAALYCSRVILDEADVPVNEGAFAPVRIVLPHGTLVNPDWPGAVNGRGITMMAMLEALFEAMSNQQPGRAAAGSSVNHVLSMASFDRAAARYRVVTDNDYGGVGARASMDGVDVTGAGLLGGRSFTVPIEGVELENPLRYECYRLRVDSGGAGRYRGGLGAERTVTFLEDATASMRADKFAHPPKGIAGGQPGAPGAWIFNLGREDERRLASKETNVALRPGDTLTMLTPGGGGLGDPAERRRESVVADVADGRVSPAAAAHVYGLASAEGGPRHG